VVVVVVRRISRKPIRWTSSSTTVTAMHDNIKYIHVDGNQYRTISSLEIFQILNFSILQLAFNHYAKRASLLIFQTNKLLTMKAIFYYDSMEDSCLFKTILVSLV